MRRVPMSESKAVPREQQAPTAGRRAWPERAPTDGRGRVSAQDAVVMPRCGECESIRVCSDAQKVAGGGGGQEGQVVSSRDGLCNR